MLLIVALAALAGIVVLWFWWPEHQAAEDCRKQERHGTVTRAGRCLTCGHRAAYLRDGVYVEPLATRSLPVSYWPAELRQRREARKFGRAGGNAVTAARRGR